jgi:hypothetical protein
VVISWHMSLEIRLRKDTVSLGDKYKKAGGNSCGARGMFLTRFNLAVQAPSLVEIPTSRLFRHAIVTANCVPAYD